MKSINSGCETLFQLNRKDVTNLYGTFPLIFLGVFLGNINSRLFPINSKKMYGIFKLDKEVLQCEKGLVPGPDYMVDALKLHNQAPRVSGESLQTCVAWRCPDGTQHFFCWPILTISSQSLASNGPVVDSRVLNLVFGHAGATPNKGFLFSSTKYTVEPSCR
ncbi:hypothetical protein TNCV_1126841 [Trichonephila clavipes]|nr:hypothetical protein TNCV_1126841 [Trichonephila clavipes]